MEKRKDSKGIVLRPGEIEDKIRHRYIYRCTINGKRISLYDKSLKKLREKEEQLKNDLYNGLRCDIETLSINDIFKRWQELKKPLIRDNTMSNYCYMYTTYVQPTFGKKRIKRVVRSEIKKFYNQLADERCLSISAIETIQNVLGQVFQLAVEDNYIRVNPTSNLLREFKKARNFQAEKRKALEKSEQELFIKFLKNNTNYNHWYPVFAVMLGTGMRVGEVTGLRWQDVDFEKNTISVNHTLVYYSKGKNNGCVFAINQPKTKSGIRTIPMFPEVREALLQEKQYQEDFGITCKARVDGYTNFIFINRFGDVQHQGTLNKAIKRIIRDCNDEVLLNNDIDAEPVLLPDFSCHILRHTFTTRLCEAEMNVKTIQVVLGHSDVRTTLDIYTDVTESHKQANFSSVNGFFRGLI